MPGRSRAFTKKRTALILKEQLLKKLPVVKVKYGGQQDMRLLPKSYLKVEVEEGRVFKVRAYSMK